MARLPKLFDNSVPKERLQNYLYVSDLPSGVEDAFSGVARGNLTDHGQQHSKSLLLCLLQSLPCISSQAIQEVLECSKAHARNLAVACRTLSGALQRLPHQEWGRPSNGDLRDRGISLWALP